MKPVMRGANFGETVILRPAAVGTVTRFRLRVSCETRAKAVVVIAQASAIVMSASLILPSLPDVSVVAGEAAAEERRQRHRAPCRLVPIDVERHDVRPRAKRQIGLRIERRHRAGSDEVEIGLRVERWWPEVRI